MIYGLDIASYQGRPDFARLRADGHDFMITKVTGEGNYVNPYWSQNRDNARAAGLIVGTYDWVEPQGTQTGAEAASDYLGVVGERQPSDLLAVDFETPDWATGPHGRDIEGWMRDYLYTLRDTGGQQVIVYTAPYFLAETGAANWAWLGQDFIYWEAAPGPGAMLPDDAPWPSGGAPWGEPAIHQHQWHAHNPGVVGEFDRDRFQGTREELMALGKKVEIALDSNLIIARSYIDPQGVPVTEIKWGGKAVEILGTDYKDIGIRVANAAGKTYHRSIQDGIGKEYVEE